MGYSYLVLESGLLMRGSPVSSSVLENQDFVSPSENSITEIKRILYFSSIPLSKLACCHVMSCFQVGYNLKDLILNHMNILLFLGPKES